MLTDPYNLTYLRYVPQYYHLQPHRYSGISFNFFQFSTFITELLLPSSDLRIEEISAYVQSVKKVFVQHNFFPHFLVFLCQWRSQGVGFAVQTDSEMKWNSKTAGWY